MNPIKYVQDTMNRIGSDNVSIAISLSKSDLKELKKTYIITDGPFGFKKFAKKKDK